MTEDTEIENLLAYLTKNDTLTETDKNPLADIELQKLHLAEVFLSSGINQKTEISFTERVNLPILKQLAVNSFPISQKILGETPHTIPFLSDWLQEFFKLGIPLNRKGRNEEVRVLQAALSSEPLPENENNNVSKILK